MLRFHLSHSWKCLFKQVSSAKRQQYADSFGSVFILCIHNPEVCKIRCCELKWQCSLDYNVNVRLFLVHNLETKRSFVHAISIAPLQVHYYSVALCQSFTPKRHRQLRANDLPKVRIRGSYRVGVEPITLQTKRRRQLYQ